MVNSGVGHWLQSILFCALYLGNTESCHILTKWGSAIACAKSPCQQRAQPFNTDAPADGVLGGRRCSWELGAWMVVAHRLWYRAYYSRHHAKHTCQAHSWHPPLTWMGSQISDWWRIYKNIFQQCHVFLWTYLDKEMWTRKLRSPHFPSHQCGPGSHIELDQMVGHHRWWGGSRLTTRPQCPAESNQHLILVSVSVFSVSVLLSVT